jgi:hypothetical protein
LIASANSLLDLGPDWAIALGAVATITLATPNALISPSPTAGRQFLKVWPNVRMYVPPPFRIISI